MKLQDLSNKGNTKTLPFTYSKYEREREVLFKAMKKNTAKKTNTLTSTIKDVLGEQNFMHETTNLRGKHLKSM